MSRPIQAIYATSMSSRNIKKKKRKQSSISWNCIQCEQQLCVWKDNFPIIVAQRNEQIMQTTYKFCSIPMIIGLGPVSFTELPQQHIPESYIVKQKHQKEELIISTTPSSSCGKSLSITYSFNYKSLKLITTRVASSRRFKVLKTKAINEASFETVPNSPMDWIDYAYPK